MDSYSQQLIGVLQWQILNVQSAFSIVKGLNPGVISYSVGWVWSSEWSYSWIGLLLLTVTDVSTTCAVVIVETAVTVTNNSSIQDYVHLDDHTQPNYALSINTVLVRQKISGRGSRRTVKKGEKKFPERITDGTLSYFCFVFFPLCPPISFHLWYDMFVRFVWNSVLQAQNFYLLLILFSHFCCCCG